MGQPAEQTNTTALQQKFLAVEVCGHGYGIPIETVKEIVYHSRINPLPQTPAFVRGVSLIRNETMPVLDLNILLGKNEITEIHHESCFIVIQLADKSGKLTHICLLADRILQTYKVDRDDVDSIPQVDKQVIVEYVRGIARFDDDLFIVIDPAGLISPYMDEINGYDIYRESEKNRQETGDDQYLAKIKNKSQVSKYLSASIAGEEYAIPLTNVFQVIGKKDLKKYSDDDLPGFLASATIINNKVVGIVKLKDVLAENEEVTEKVHNTDEVINQEVVVLVDFDESMLGIMVDKIGRTYECHEELKQHSFCSNLNRNRIKSLGFIESEEGCIEVIEPTGVLVNSERSEVVSWMGCVEQIYKMSDLQNKAADTEKQIDEDNHFAKYAGSYLIVQVGKQLVGIKNDNVDEVLTFDDLIPLSNSPSWFMGLLDLRQNTYPVIDLLSRLDVDKDNAVDEQRKVLVMVKHDNEKIALHVNHIVNSSAIKEEHLQGLEDSELFVNNEALLAVAKVDVGLVHIVNMEKIVSGEEISARRLLNELQAQSNSSKL